MLDFTSALYLGMTHEHAELRPWSRLSLGVPLALREPEEMRAVANAIAQLQGCEAGVLAPSTLHLFWDLLGIYANDNVAIYLDDGVYPIARWGAERARGRGAPVHSFRHHDAGLLRQVVFSTLRRGARPVVVTDGFCPACGRSAPLAAYLDCVRDFGGRPVVDDTQALAVLGAAPSSHAPYGHGGGGSLRFQGVSDAAVVLVSSLAKGLGVPVAVLSGSAAAIRYFENKSDSRMYCSPPSIAVARAAQHAIEINRREGATLRACLARIVKYFHERLGRLGFALTGGPFPVQSTLATGSLSPDALYHQLLRAGVRTFLNRCRHGAATCLTFLLTARHQRTDIDQLASLLSRMLGSGRRTWGLHHDARTRA